MTNFNQTSVQNSATNLMPFGEWLDCEQLILEVAEDGIIFLNENPEIVEIGTDGKGLEIKQPEWHSSSI